MQLAEVLGGVNWMLLFVCECVCLLSVVFFFPFVSSRWPVQYCTVQYCIVVRAHECVCVCWRRCRVGRTHTHTHKHMKFSLFFLSGSAIISLLLLLLFRCPSWHDGHLCACVSKMRIQDQMFAGSVCLSEYIFAPLSFFENQSYQFVCVGQHNKSFGASCCCSWDTQKARTCKAKTEKKTNGPPHEPIHQLPLSLSCCIHHQQQQQQQQQY